MKSQRWVPYLSVLPREPRKAPESVGTPGTPDYLDLGRWWDNLRPGHTCDRGFVSNEKFAGGGDIVIQRTNRAAQRNRK